MAFNYNDLEWEDGSENMGGMKGVAYVCPASKIETWPAMTVSPVTDREKVTLMGDYVCKEGASFKKCYATPQTSALTFDPQGEIDGKSFLQKAGFFHPGTQNENLAFARDVNNSGCVVIFEDLDGTRNVLGVEGLPARITPKGGPGMKPADRRGIQYDIEADSFVPISKYEGIIPLSDATLPGISS